jgi:DNA-binding PadR family transcriptional regulator
MLNHHPRLPNTSYAVLGLLSFGQELSGYELRRWAENLRFFYWSPAQSQIYGELRRLAQLGLVDSREVPQQGRPDKRLYMITRSGLEEVRRWLNDGPVEPVILKHSVALRLFFGHLADPGRLQALLEEFVRETEERLAELTDVRARLDDRVRFGFPDLVAAWGQRYYEAEVATAREMLERLSHESESSAT